MIRALLVLMACLLISCGGGGSEPAQIRVAFYGDSVTSGDGLSPRPVPEIAAMAGVVGIDHSRGGDWACNWRTVLDDDADVIVLRFAAADAVAHGMGGIDDFEACLVVLAGSTRKPVILTGTVWTAQPDGLSPATYEALSQAVTAYDARVRAVARTLRVPFVDIRSLPFAGRQDLRDDVHPSQAYSERISRLVADAITAILATPRK
jgi:hypothetical protein